MLLIFIKIYVKRIINVKNELYFLNASFYINAVREYEGVTLGREAN
jgi:hypothetical protein